MEENEMKSRKPKFVWLATSIYVLAGIVLISFAVILFYTQIQLNKTLDNAVYAITVSVQQPSPVADGNVDYHAALTYLEAARQLYAENNSINVASLVYVLMSTVILAYGSKILRISEEDKMGILESAKKTVVSELKLNFKEMLDNKSDSLKSELESKLLIESMSIVEKQTKQLEIISRCDAVVNCAYLLRSKLAGPINETNEVEIEALERFQIELARNLKALVSFQESYDADQDYAIIRKAYLRAIRATEGFLEMKKPDFINNDDYIRTLIRDCKKICK